MSSFKKLIMMANQAPKKQNRVYWNQGVQRGVIRENTSLTQTYDADNDVMVLNGQNTENVTIYNIPSQGAILTWGVQGHVYCCLMEIVGGRFDGNASVISVGNTYIYAKYGAQREEYIVRNEVSFFYPLVNYKAGDVFEDFQYRVKYWDLTLMFGAGNEPTTTEEFYQRIEGIPVDIYEYNTGEWIEW